MTFTDKQVEAACVAMHGEMEFSMASEKLRDRYLGEMRAALEAAEAAREPADYPNPGAPARLRPAVPEQPPSADDAPRAADHVALPKRVRPPIQPLYVCPIDGRLRFQPNLLVQHLLDHGGLDMNALSRVDVPRSDREQFAQLIGYSHHGFGTLSYATDRVFDTALERFERRMNPPAAPPADARDAGLALLRQAIAAMSKLRQSLEFPGKHGGLYVFPEEAVRNFTDEQARLMYEENQLAAAVQAGVADSDRLEFVMRHFQGSAARTIDDYRAAIDRAMGAGGES